MDRPHENAPNLTPCHYHLISVMNVTFWREPSPKLAMRAICHEIDGLNNPVPYNFDLLKRNFGNGIVVRMLILREFRDR